MHVPFRPARLAAGLALAAALSAQATIVDVTVQNLVPAGGIAFAPLHVGFHGRGRRRRRERGGTEQRARGPMAERRAGHGTAPAGGVRHGPIGRRPRAPVLTPA
ncbi:MAG: hypothetical protein Fur0014_01780 [Rubrivivax sp.]